MLLTDLRELKATLEINPNNTAEDKKLSFFVEQATSWIGEFLNRDITYKSRTVYYNGTGTQKLALRHRPVYPMLGTAQQLTVYVDEAGYFGSPPGPPTPFDPTTSLETYGTDYCLSIDQDDGGSRSGILYRLNELWPKPAVRQVGLLSPFVGPSIGNVKVVYTAGYTQDTLPPELRLAINILVARMRYLMPLGMELGSESYEERAISIVSDRRSYLMGLIKPILWGHRNFKFF